MQNLKLFVLIFAVPMGGILASGIFAAHMESQLHEALLNAAPRSGRKVDSAFRQRIDGGELFEQALELEFRDGPQQVRLVVHVGVQGRGADPQFAPDPPQRQGFQAAGLGNHCQGGKV